MTIHLPYIQNVMNDPTVDEILVDGWQHVYVERDGTLADIPTPFQSEAELLGLVQAFAEILNVPLDETNPIVSLRLPDYSRVEIILPPISVIGPAIVIRKESPQKIDLADLLRWGALTQPAADFLKACVQGRVNIAVSGFRGSGKITLLNNLARWIPIDERILILQSEMRDRGLPHPHLLSLETRPPNREGKGEVTLSDLLLSALRMRPDRILVEELKGAEASELVYAMNSGHDGCLFTLTSLSPRDTLSRLEGFVAMGHPELPMRAIREQVSSAVDLIVHIEKMRDGSRKVVNITEVTGIEDGVITLSDIFLYEITGFAGGVVQGSLRPTGIIPRFLDMLNGAGIQAPVSLFTPAAP